MGLPLLLRLNANDFCARTRRRTAGRGYYNIRARCMQRLLAGGRRYRNVPLQNPNYHTTILQISYLNSQIVSTILRQFDNII